ncbi:MAG: hypothetical protein NTU44_10895, partial [Bacteroidetes bacterium]|nr:hypothetical protein [Bacteroidota bacterium]
MDKLTILLGSGFSYKAGLPLAKDIEPYFQRNNTENLLHFPSGEWKWNDYASSADLTNGKLSYDWLAYGCILNVLVAEYVKDKGSFENYEAFYQYIIDNSSNWNFLEDIYKKAKDMFDGKDILASTDPNYQDYTQAFQQPSSKELTNLVNHLIDDLLYCRKPQEEVLSSYTPFLHYIKDVKELYIITLNHDIVLEFLLKSIPERPYSDGFSYQNTSLFSTNDKPIRTYSGDFETTI